MKRRDFFKKLGVFAALGGFGSAFALNRDAIRFAVDSGGFSRRNRDFGALLAQADTNKSTKNINTSSKNANLKAKKVAVLAANGKAGRAAVAEFLRAGCEVVGFIRGDISSKKFENAAKAVQKDIFELKAADLAEFDIIVDAFGEWKNLDLHQRHIRYLSAILSEAKWAGKLLVVGGAGSLFLDKEHTKMLLDSEQFPSSYRPIANAQSEALSALRTFSAINWVFVSPAAEFVANGERKGVFEIFGEEFSTDKNGKSIISYADYALALVRIASDANLARMRLSVRY